MNIDELTELRKKILELIHAERKSVEASFGCGATTWTKRAIRRDHILRETQKLACRVLSIPDQEKSRELERTILGSSTSRGRRRSQPIW